MKQICVLTLNQYHKNLNSFHSYTPAIECPSQVIAVIRLLAELAPMLLAFSSLDNHSLDFIVCMFGGSTGDTEA